MTFDIIPTFAALAIIAGCAPVTTASDRPMDEVPVQRTLATSEREYAFKSGCTIVLEPQRSVVVSERGACELHHRDIALLYASAD